MDNTIGRNIARLRKENGMTQEALAGKLSVSFQAVSRWENGVTIPDVDTLMGVAAIMHVSIDALAGYTHTPKAVSPYQEWYKQPEYYWGTEPSSLCLKIIASLPPVRPYRLLDVGSGELFALYGDWRFEHMEEKIFDCNSSGVPHQHCMDVMVARKM